MQLKDIKEEADGEFDSKFADVDGEDFQGWIVNDRQERNLPCEKDRTGLVAVKQFLTSQIEKACRSMEKEIFVSKIYGQSLDINRAKHIIGFNDAITEQEALIKKFLNK